MLVLGLASGASAQGRVFYEPGDRSSGATTECPAVLTSRDGVAHRFPGAALECGWDGTLDWQNPAKTLELELASLPMRAERLVRGWFRVDANVDAGPGSKLMRLGYGSSNEIIISCQFENVTPTIWVGVNGQPSFWGNGSPACRQGWQQLEIYQSPTLIRVWQNDVLLREWTGAFNVSSMVTWMSQWSNNDGWGHDAMNKVYWQRLEAFTDAGTGGVGSMREGTMTQGGTPPPPPPVEICGDGIDNDADGQVDEGCVIVPPPPPAVNLTIITAVKTCRVTIQSQPPDTTGGWGVQFRWDLNNFGSKDTSAPFERARDFAAGTYQLGAIWTKTGQTPVFVPSQPYECK